MVLRLFLPYIAFSAPEMLNTVVTNPFSLIKPHKIQFAPIQFHAIPCLKMKGSTGAI
jgi:1-deoxy-D-xylulose 5-phosphate reductoisomerase